MVDVLSPQETKLVNPGQVVVNVGADVWKTWPNASSISGAIVGMVLVGGLPGNFITVTTIGRFPFYAYNLGPGNASQVVAGNLPARGTTGLVIGTCDSSGEIFLFPSSVIQASINAPVFVTGLSAITPTSSRAEQVVDGYATAGDGGEGLFVYKAGDARAADGGTIISCTGGNWVRVIEGNGYNVRWFGAKGDGTTNESAAFINCAKAVQAEMTRDGQVNPEIGNGPYIFVPRGRYKIVTTIEMPNGMWMRGEGSSDQTILLEPTHTVHILRMGAFNNGVENIGFMGGKAGIIMWGPSVNFGNLDVITSFGSVQIRKCKFRANAFPSIYLDTSTAHRGSPSTLLVEGCDGYTGSIFYGGFDAAWFHKCTILSTDGPVPPGVGPDWGVATPRDSNGNRLAIWNSYDSILIDDCFVTPGADGTVFPSTYVIQGTGNITMQNTHVGGETSLGVVRTIQASLTFDGQPLSVVSFGSLPEVRLFDNILACTGRGATVYVNGRNVMECVDVIPTVFDIRQSSTNGTGGLAGLGLVWIDSATIAKSTYTSLNRNSTYWNIEGFPDVNYANRIRTGTNPQSPDGEDVTPYLMPYMTDTSWPKANQVFGSGQIANLWPTGKQSYGTADATPGISNGSFGAAETKTGYALIPWTASAFPSTVRADYYHITDGLARGLYTLSFSILSNVSSEMQIRAVSNAGGALQVIDNISFVSAPELQRFKVSFYHDGSTSHGFGFTCFTLPFADAVNPVTATISLGLFKLEAGNQATTFSTGQTNVSDGVVVTHYYVNGAPPATGGPYRLGDIAWNVNFQTSNVDYWRCVGAGSPGSWQAGNLLAFDPAQVPIYSLDYDAASLTAGAITAWADKAGSVPGANHNLTGTATAHASGGTGPNGAAYVQGNGTTDKMLFDVYPGAPITIVGTEWYIVAKWNDAGSGTTGTLFDGVVFSGSATPTNGNVARVYRDASATNFKFTGNASDHVISTLTQGAWAIYHVIYDTVAGQMTVEVNNSLLFTAATAAGATTGGISLFNYPVGNADPAAVSIARVIGFIRTLGNTGDGHLTAAQHTSMTNYLAALYGIGSSTSQGDIVTTRTVTTATDIMAASDAIILVNRAGIVSETLPPPIAGKRIRVTDISGNASVNNITILPNGGETINGAGSFVINTNRGSIDFDSDGTNWFAA